MAVSETSPLRAKREAEGLRLVDVAERAGISVGYLSMIERGLVCPTPVQERLAVALECTPAQVFR